MLSDLGYRVVSVNTGRAAVKYLGENDVDLVLLDMIMEPDFDGLDTVQAIFRLHPHQKIIVVSGFSATERVQQLQRLCGGPYIRKPYTVEHLSRMVRNVLDNKTSTPELRPALLS